MIFDGAKGSVARKSASRRIESTYVLVAGKVPEQGDLAQCPASKNDLVEDARDHLDRNRFARNLVLGGNDETVGALAEL